jgi:hypothetical protein
VKTELSVISGGKDGSESGGVGSKAWSKKVRARAKELVETIEKSFMELGEILFYVWDTPEDGDRANGPVWMKWGYKSFRDYAEQELGIHYKRAERLRYIFYRIDVELEGLDPKWKKRLIALGESKVRELCRPTVLTLSNAKGWIEKAENMNYQTVDAAVKKYLEAKEKAEIHSKIAAKGDPIAKSNKLSDEKTETELAEEEEEDAAPPAPKELDWDHPEHFKSKVFAFTADQLESVHNALDRAKELTNSKSNGHNLSLICLDYVATNDFTKASEEQRLRYVAKMEKLLGYKFIVVDPKTKEILFGIGTLEKVSKALGD